MSATTVRREGAGAGAVVEAVQGDGADGAEGTISKGVAYVAAGFLALALAMMADDLASGHTSESASGEAALAMGAAVALPGIFLFVDVDIVVAVVVTFASILALVEEALVAATTAVDFLDAALVVVILIVAGASDLAVGVCLGALDKLVGGLALTNNDGLGHFLADNDRLLRGRGLVADDDGLWLGLGRIGSLWAVVLALEWVVLEVVFGVFTLVALDVTLVFARNADLAIRCVLVRGCGRRWAVRVPIFADGAGGCFWALNRVLLADLAAVVVLVVVAGAVDKAHAVLVGVVVEAVVGHAVALNGCVATGAVRRRVPVALALTLTLLVHDRHGGAGRTGRTGEAGEGDVGGEWGESDGDGEGEGEGEGKSEEKGERGRERERVMLAEG
jgi:hypothetical protein